MLKELFLLDEGPVQKVSASNGCGWWITRGSTLNTEINPFYSGPNLVSSSSVCSLQHPSIIATTGDIKTNNGPPPLLTWAGHPWSPPHRMSPPPGPGPRPPRPPINVWRPGGRARHSDTQTQNKCSVELDPSLWVDTAVKHNFTLIQVDWKWTVVHRITKNKSLIGGVTQ